MQPTIAKNAPASFIRACGYAGIAAFLADAVGTTILGFLKAGYDPVRSTISELGERGGERAALAAAAFIAIGLLEVLFALGLFLRSRPSKAALAGSALMAVNGLSDYVGSGLFPCDAGGRYDSPSGRVHLAVSVVGMAAMVFPAFLYRRAFSKAGRRFEAAASAIAAFFVAAAALAFNIAFFTEAPWLGLAQRIIDFGYFAWVLALGARMAAE